MAELRNVDVAESLELVAEGALLLDVREVNEWEAGHAPQAVHVPLGDVPDLLDDLAPDRLIVCVCRSGARSSRAGRFLAEQGFEAVNLEGGMLAWSSEGEPLVAANGEPAVI